MMGLAHQLRISISARYFGSTGSRVSITIMAASACSISARSTLASCSKLRLASGPRRKARTRSGRESASSVFRYSSSATESSSPGVSMKRTATAPSRRRSMASAWRVVPGRSDTSPKSTWRVSVRSSEVLPALVWPTMAMRSGSVMVMKLPPLPLAGEGWGEGMQCCGWSRRPLTPALSPEGRGSSVPGVAAGKKRHRHVVIHRQTLSN